MKIYTRTGDKGTTGLLGGERVRKDDIRIEAYGTVDELNSHLGLLKDMSPDDYNSCIIEMQNTLFHIGSRLASSKEPDPSWGIKSIESEDIELLEKQMDSWNEQLPAMKNFILPGGHPAVSQAHICRCVCRRAERRVISFSDDHPVDENVIKYLNRSSDLLFVMARMIAFNANIGETPWIPSA
jgi:cob(I)alamin adenosyltransferase